MTTSYTSRPSISSNPPETVDFGFSKIGHTGYLDICWDLLNLCNLNCPYCYARKEYQTRKEYKDSLLLVFTKPKCDRVLSQLKCIKNDIHVGLLGGEPTLNPNLNYIIQSLDSFNNVKKIKLVTNGTRLLSDLFLSDKLEINFSCHPSQGNFDSIYKNVILLKNKTKIITHILMDSPSRAEEYYNQLKDHCDTRPEYIIRNDQVYFVGTKIPEPKLYQDKNQTYTFRECYDKSFKGCRCLLTHYCIYANGDVYRECVETRVGNILRENIVFTNKPQICQKQNCHDDFLLEIPKLIRS